MAVVLCEAPRKASERAKIVASTLDGVEEHGPPQGYPAEMHLAAREELKLLGKAKLVKASDARKRAPMMLRKRRDVRACSLALSIYLEALKTRFPRGCLA